ncbi:MAG: cell division protein SepF [Candidatus Izimaplasma sp.]|nr:cell division protein SepF [Candidatus Izimaplasma bacterium]
MFRRSAAKRLEFVMFQSDTDIYKLANKLLKGVPIMINFEEFKDFESNKALTFLSGVTYAIDGEIEQIQERIFLFATKKDFKDNSLRKFVEEYKE